VSSVAEWRSQVHLEDHYGFHHRELRVRSIEEDDASAQETIVLSVGFTYRDTVTGEPRVGYFRRDTSRFTALDDEGFVRTHFRTDEAYVVGLPLNTYRD